MVKGSFVRASVALAFLLAAGCGAGDTGGQDKGVEMGSAAPLEVRATNAFYYYADLEGAWDFYTRVLGFETVADYGFAKMLRVSPASYLTLVDEKEGMHDSTEPKSVTLAVVTEEVEGWWDYLRAQGVEMRAPLGEVTPGRPHDGFVAVDPEGYFLEFERFNAHPENTNLIPVLEEISPLRVQPGQEVAPGVVSTRPPELGVKATILWLYYQDLEGIQAFYGEVFRRDIMVDQGWAKVLPVSSTGFLGFVDGERGLHSATPEKAVTVSFFTESLDGWLAHLRDLAGFTFRTDEVLSEGDFVHTFVGYDPEGYYLEWDTFLDVPVNQRLLRELADLRGPSEGG